MSLRITLLGRPAVAAGSGSPRRPKGRKPWALLLYLLSSDRPLSREHLAGLLFAEANDPLAALRWNLAELRRLLGPGCVVADERIALSLPAGTHVDVLVLRHGTWADALELPELGRELLEGMQFSGSPAFEAWLLQERRHAEGLTESVLHETVLFHLARDAHADAIASATRLVGLNPYEESFHELLVRSYARAGDVRAARAHLGACVELFRRELGRDPGRAVHQAVEDRPVPRTAGAPSSAGARAQLETGESAISAGAVDSGLASLRRAVAGAEAAGDHALTAQALLALGRALVHAMRGGDAEGAAALRRAVLLAGPSGDGQTLALAYGELGYIEVLRGRGDRALRLLGRAREHARGHDCETAAIETTAGMALSDMARHGQAARCLRRAVAHAEAAGDGRRLSYALSMVGRLHLLRRELDPARATLERSLGLARDQGWFGFLPWPEALLADLDLLEDDVASATARFEHAFALGCELADPCWEGISGRGLGLVRAREDPASAIDLLDAARRRAARASDGYRWVEVYALDALCDVATRVGDPQAPDRAEELRRLAGHLGMRDFVVSSYEYAARLGEAGAADAARALAGELDDPSRPRLQAPAGVAA